MSLAYKILCASYAIRAICPLSIGVIHTCTLDGCTFYLQYKMMNFHKLYMFFFSYFAYIMKYSFFFRGDYHYE